jgi:site-specific recombinase XerD
MTNILPMPQTAGRSWEPPARIRYMTQRELSDFRAAVVRAGSKRDLALFGAWYVYAMRVSEVAGMRFSDFRPEDSRISIQRAKGGKHAEYPVPDSLKKALQRWCRVRKPGPWLWPSARESNQQGISSRTLKRLFTHYRQAAGLRADLTSHSLRHSRAVHALEAGVSLEMVAEMLGHRSLSATQVYACITSEARDKAFERLETSESIVRW